MRRTLRFHLFHMIIALFHFGSQSGVFTAWSIGSIDVFCCCAVCFLFQSRELFVTLYFNS